MRTPEPGLLAQAARDAGARVSPAAAAGAGDGQPGLPGPRGLAGPAELEVSGLTEEQVGDIAFANGICLHHLSASRASLEQAFMELTAGHVDYQAGPPASRPGPPASRPAAQHGIEA